MAVESIVRMQSVDAWVKEMKLNPALNLVILYKPQGTTQLDNCDNLCENFLIALQIPLLAEVFKAFGNENTVY